MITRRQLLTLLASAGVGGGIYAFVDGPRDAGQAEEAAQQVYDDINAFREQHGRGTLNWDAELAEIARGHALDMVNNFYSNHTTPEGKTVKDRYLEAGYPCESPGEIIYQGRSFVQENGALDSWRDSDPHRDALLSPSWGQVGVGVGTRFEVGFVVANFC